MKKVILLGLLTIAGFSSSALAQVTEVPGQKYREYQLKAVLCNGEAKTATLQVNVNIEKTGMDDPDIVGNHFINGTIIEGKHTCSFSVLLAQSRKGHNEDITYYGAEVKLCSGMYFKLEAAKVLTEVSSSQVELFFLGASRPIATGFLNFSVEKTVPATEPYDD